MKSAQRVRFKNPLTGEVETVSADRLSVAEIQKSADLGDPNACFDDSGVCPFDPADLERIEIEKAADLPVDEHPELAIFDNIFPWG